MKLAFSDQTAAANLSFTHDTFSRTELNIMISGAAAGDFNRDGWPDLFVIGGGNRPDALFINQQDGTFQEEGAAWGVGVSHRGSGAAVGDYDNDGWLDIFVTSHGITQTAISGAHRLYRNNQDNSFSQVARKAGVHQGSPTAADGFGATFGDYDLDGDLDLFITGWRPTRAGNRLFRNNGDGTFDDVTDDAGQFNEGLQGFSPCFSDMDGDRYPELLVAGDFDTTKYFVNNRDGTFTDQSEEAGVAISINGMGSTVADLNNDGLQDWYVTSIYQSILNEGGDGNRLFMNQGDHRFVERAAASGVDDGRWGWGTVAMDLDHDGWLDLVETNGWPQEAQFVNQPALLWMNRHDGTFTESAADAGLVYALDGQGLLGFDYDNDGDQDLIFTSNNGKLYLYRNDLIQGDTESDTSWLRILLDTSHHPALAPNGIGARVEVHAGEQTYIRHIQACSNYLSQNEISAHFGLHETTRIDRVQVLWPNGSATVVNDLAINQTHTLMPPVLNHTLYLPIVIR